MVQTNYSDDFTITLQANETLVANALVVLLSTGKVENADATTDECIGHAIKDAAADEWVGVRLFSAPSHNGIASAAIAVGSKVFPTATAGKIDDTGVIATDTVLGVALTAAAAADDIITYIPIRYPT